MHELSRLHFLVHPGFNDQFTKTDDKIRQWSEMYRTWMQAARGLGQNEFMFIFTYATFLEMRNELKSPKRYVDFLHSIKEILGNNGAVLCGEYDVLSIDEYPVTHMDPMLQARGFYYTRDVETYCYGEHYKACVPDTADHLNRAMGLANKTKVPLLLTNAVVQNETDPDDYNKWLHTELSYNRNVFGRNLYTRVEGILQIPPR